MIALSSFPKDAGSRTSLKISLLNFVAAVREREISPQRKWTFDSHLLLSLKVSYPPSDLTITPRELFCALDSDYIFFLSKEWRKELLWLRSNWVCRILNFPEEAACRQMGFRISQWIRLLLSILINFEYYRTFIIYGVYPWGMMQMPLLRFTLDVLFSRLVILSSF